MLYDEGAAGSPKMMSVGLHCRLVGRPGRAAALAQFLDYVRGKEKVWVATRVDIARALAGEASGAGGGRAAVGDGDGRISSRGSAGSSSIRRGWRSGRGSWSSGRRMTPRSGCIGAGAGVPAPASEQERLGVLTAHPDLAGKLAAAKRLTAESTSEQACAGLDALTDDERARFTELNDAYQAKFGFPFIIAVRGPRARRGSWRRSRRGSATTARPSSPPPAQVERIALLRLKDMLK